MLRSWHLHIEISRTSAVSMATQLLQGIISRIRSGGLSPGTPLPSSRELALQIGVNRKTVVHVYEELVAQGWLTTQGTRGTFVSPRLPMVHLERKAARIRKLNHDTVSVPGYPVYGADKDLPIQTDDGDIDFTDGVPDTRIAPFGAISRAFRLALIDLARETLHKRPSCSAI